MIFQRIHRKTTSSKLIVFPCKRLLGVAAICLLMPIAGSSASDRHHAGVDKQTVGESNAVDAPQFRYATTEPDSRSRPVDSDGVLFSQAVGTKCQTQYGICPLPQPGPIGWLCYCGDAQGTIVP